MADAFLISRNGRFSLNAFTLATTVVYRKSECNKKFTGKIPAKKGRKTNKKGGCAEAQPPVKEEFS